MAVHLVVDHDAEPTNPGERFATPPLLGITGSLRPTVVALVAPDLRVVAQAVERGLGASLLPSDLCRHALADGTLIDVYPVAELVPDEPRALSTRSGASDRPDVEHVAAMILGAA